MQTGAFINSLGNPVPKAGTFYNGANIDKGPSDLSLGHTFLLHGIVQLPWNSSISSIKVMSLLCKVSMVLLLSLAAPFNVCLDARARLEFGSSSSSLL